MGGVLVRQEVENVGESLRVLNHWEVAAGDLERLDAKQFACHEPLPLGLEELVLARVDERRGYVGMARQREIACRRSRRTKAVRQILSRVSGKARVHRLDCRLALPDVRPVRAARRKRKAG